MIVQNLGADGTTDMTFTVGKADLARAREVLDRRAARDRLRRDRWPTRTWRRSSVVGIGMRSHAGVASHHVPGAGRQGHQHPGHLDQRDQGERAGRRRNTPSSRCARCTPPTGWTRLMPPRLRTPPHRPDATSAAATRSAPARRWTGLMARGAAFLGSALAIMGGAMSWVSERHLVAALSNAGGLRGHRLRRDGAGPAGGRRSPPPRR